MSGRPDRAEADESYWSYIDRVQGEYVLACLHRQLEEARQLLGGVSEERSLYRYAPGKWSVRESLNHISDNERSFVFRALWFARGFSEPLLGFDENVAAAGAEADLLTLAAHLEEFLEVRAATISFFRNLTESAWTKTGFANGKLFTVRAIAFITAGHTAHHFAILRERYHIDGV